MGELLPEPWPSFLGRFHPLMVHLPIGFLLVVVLLELAGKLKALAGLAAANRLILAIAALAAIGAAAAGYFLSLEGGYNASLISWHMWSGFAVAGGCALAFVLHCINRRGLYHLTLLATVTVLFIASHFGGTLTHGQGYLTEHMPASLRRAIGLTTATGPTRPAVDDPMQLKAYNDLVQPVFNQYCVDCHGPAKAKDGLRLDTHQRILAGGDEGSVVTPGKPQESELIEYMLKPLDADDHMPPEGNPQPTDDDIALIGWWIQNGAEADTRIRQMTLPPQVASVLSDRFGGTRGTTMKPVDQLQTTIRTLREKHGLTIQRIAQKSNALRVSARNVNGSFGDEQVKQLKPLAGNIRWLNLAGTNVTDDALATIGEMTNLTRLHLEHTKVRDQGLEHFTRLWQLQYLNLYGTEVSNAALPTLKRLPRLKRVYLWKTNVTPDAARRFKQAFDNPVRVQQWKKQIDALRQKIESLQSHIRQQGVEVRLGADQPAAESNTEAQSSSSALGQPASEPSS
jgi:mono/diheme cytochrome c family protein